MAFIDEINLEITAGKGGDGVVRWLHEKGKEFGGPAGGDGGRGGDVFIRGIRDITLLSSYRGNNVFHAEDGGDGKARGRHGKDGTPLHLSLPIGSTIKDTETGEVYELLYDGEEIKVLSGGSGGFGNEHFKSSRNVRPKEWTAGKRGESAHFYVELSLIADAGLIGLPNAGKSSLLNELTRAHAKVGSYPFTTLEPNLGDFYGFILADIPGLIEGASEGKGLGHKFLRHIKRSRMLIHCISCESEDVLRDYHLVRAELSQYGSDLGKKSEIVVLTKSDTVDKEILEEKKKELSGQTQGGVYSVSILHSEQLKLFSETLARILHSAESGGV